MKIEVKPKKDSHIGRTTKKLVECLKLFDIKVLETEETEGVIRVKCDDSAGNLAMELFGKLPDLVESVNMAA